MDDRNLRSVLQGSSLTRTMRYMEMLDEDDLDEGIREVVLFLSDHFPLGNKRDARGASLKQLGYICILADFDEDLTREFGRTVNAGGGLDSGQAHTIITKLREKKAQPKRYVG